jgi:hypothetical protein
MEFIQVKLLDKIDNLIKLSNDFDNGFKIIYEINVNELNKENIELLYSMTKNYILIRKEHGEILLIMHKFTNSLNMDINKTLEKKSTKNISKINEDNNDMDYSENTRLFYDLSTFNTLLGNINDLINNIDYEYKKIAIKYPNFINKKQMMIILVSQDSDDKYIKLIGELEKSHPEHKYKIIKCGNKKGDISKCEEELMEYEIKIKSKSLPLIYIVNNSTVSEIPISKIDGIEPIKDMIK